MTKPTPDWAPRYWRFKSLSHDEARNFLCGLAPDPGNDMPQKLFTSNRGEKPPDFWARVRKQTVDEYKRDELRRVDADHYIEDWVRRGELHILEPPNSRILQKVKRILTDNEFEIVTRAVEDHLSYSKFGRYATHELIRVARSHPDLVPDCPLPADDFKSTRVTEELKDHRRVLVKRALKGKSQNQFCQKNKALGITPDILRGVINGESRRVDLATWTPTILDLLAINETDWHSM